MARAQLWSIAVREGKGDFGYNARTEVFEDLHDCRCDRPHEGDACGPGECDFHQRNGTHYRVRDRRLWRILLKPLLRLQLLPVPVAWAA